VLPCVLLEDAHLLVVNKPTGINTHAPTPYAGEGIYELLRHREPRWAKLAIIHRLDKEVSGVLVFSKTPLANRSLTRQFTSGKVRKSYVLLTDRKPGRKEFTVKTCLVRVGDRYVSRPLHAGGHVAETLFRFPGGAQASRLTYEVVEAQPLTGRTHQIRVHAAANGFPILGDALYGGTPARRVYLHAAELALRHPATGKEITFRVQVDFDADPRSGLRAAVVEPELTDAYRLIHGASDGWPSWYVDRLGKYLVSQSAGRLSQAEADELGRLMERCSAHGAYHKLLTRQMQRASPSETTPALVLGETPPERFTIQENGLQFELSLSQGHSTGLFLDQRDNRRRLLTGHIAAGFPLFQLEIGNRKSELLNAFAYTCGFSVCAAKAGAHTTNLDLSRVYLEWGKRNFALNHIPPADHEFIYGDVFDWLRRLAKKGRRFDVILLDPPTFSRSKAGAVFRAEKDFGELLGAALPLLRGGGVLFASTNAADWPPEKFLAAVEEAIRAGKRKVVQRHYVPQPSDFPVSRSEPAYLKTVWLRIE